jgi:hypothetical protein
VVVVGGRWLGVEVGEGREYPGLRVWRHSLALFPRDLFSPLTNVSLGIEQCRGF